MKIGYVKKQIGYGYYEDVDGVISFEYTSILEYNHGGKILDGNIIDYITYVGKKWDIPVYYINDEFILVYEKMNWVVYHRCDPNICGLNITNNLNFIDEL